MYVVSVYLTVALALVISSTGARTRVTHAVAVALSPSRFVPVMLIRFVPTLKPATSTLQGETAANEPPPPRLFVQYRSPITFALFVPVIVRLVKLFGTVAGSLVMCIIGAIGSGVSPS
jgi:hypothetical protein